MAKSTKLIDIQSPQTSQASMAEHTPPPLMGQVETDSLVIRITTEVLKGVEASYDKKIDPVLMRLEACSSKLAAFDTRLTKAEQRISNSEDAVANHTAKLAEVRKKLEGFLCS